VSDQLFCEILRNRGALRVMRREYRGKQFADVRAFYNDERDGTLQPGKGCTVRPEEIRAVAAALLKVAEAFEAESAG
jgi:hypothetical protein